MALKNPHIMGVGKLLDLLRFVLPPLVFHFTDFPLNFSFELMVDVLLQFEVDVILPTQKALLLRSIMYWISWFLAN